MTEKWKVVEGTEGRYLVSDKGRVYSNLSKIIMRQRVNRNGYSAVGFRINGVIKKNDVHRLVANAFIPNTLKKEQVNHIDGHKCNNHVDNLEWVTKSENIEHAYLIGLKRPSEAIIETARKLRAVPVSAFIKETGKTIDFLSARSASHYFGKKSHYFTYILNNKDGENNEYKISRLEKNNA